MKIYELYTAEEGATCCYSENNKIDILDSWKKYYQYINNDDFIVNWDTTFFYLNDEINKNKVKQNIMRYNNRYFIVDNKTKEMIASAFGEYIQFLEAVNEEDLSAKYFLLYPVRSLDALDIDKSECRFMDEEKLYISTIYKHIFKNDIEYYPVFKLRRKEVVNKSHVYATDEFKNFIEENNITGFDFVEVYDSETCNSDNETSEETKAPVSEITTHNSGNFTMGKQMIPMAHEDGIFAAGDLHSTGECLEAEYFCGMITTSANSYTVYDIDDCDMARDMEVTYSSGSLKSVYVNSGNEKVPVYMCFDFSSGSEPEGLSKAVNECVELCAAELLEELKNEQSPLGSLSQEYYYDGEQMDINLQDGSCNIYSIGNAASHMLRCICICAGEQYPGSSDFGFEIFGRILNSLHKKLSSEIPGRFDVTDDFKLYEPEMYD